jgi:hypothetical protein
MTQRRAPCSKAKRKLGVLTVADVRAHTRELGHRDELAEKVEPFLERVVMLAERDL